MLASVLFTQDSRGQITSCALECNGIVYQGHVLGVSFSSSLLFRRENTVYQQVEVDISSPGLEFLRKQLRGMCLDVRWPRSLSYIKSGLFMSRVLGIDLNTVSKTPKGLYRALVTPHKKEI
jgi:hypothetical protein